MGLSLIFLSAIIVSYLQNAKTCYIAESCGTDPHAQTGARSLANWTDSQSVNSPLLKQRKAEVPTLTPIRARAAFQADPLPERFAFRGRRLHS